MVNAKEHPRHKGYFITPCGDVYYVNGYKYRKSQEALCKQLSKDGYLRVKVFGQYRGLHRLLAETYLEKGEHHTQVNHKDLNKANNSLSNLEWCTQRENLLHAMRGNVHNMGICPVTAIPLEGAVGHYFPSQSAAGRAGFTQANIAKVLVGDRPRHKGFFWVKS